MHFHNLIGKSLASFSPFFLFVNCHLMAIEEGCRLGRVDLLCGCWCVCVCLCVIVVVWLLLWVAALFFIGTIDHEDMLALEKGAESVCV